MFPSTLYELAGVPVDVPAELVRAAALVDGAEAWRGGPAALDVLADPAARADYDARATQGLSLELALAWGVAALAAADHRQARAHFERALRIAPDDRAVPILLKTVPAGEALPQASASARDDARKEIARLRNNRAFPHRLIRYAEALAGDPAESADPDVMANAARELLQYDIAEAPRSYAMVLPVLREHYKAVYALDEPFFDATAAVLADHAPTAEYERGKRRYRESRNTPVVRDAAPPPLQMPDIDLPPLRFPERRLDLSRLPRPGYSWVGGVIGALLMIEDGPIAMVGGAVLGFALLWAIIAIVRKH